MSTQPAIYPCKICGSPATLTEICNAQNNIVNFAITCNCPMVLQPVCVLKLEGKMVLKEKNKILKQLILLWNDYQQKPEEN